MPKIKYIDWSAKKKSLEIIAQANKILDDYASQGFDLTLRQLFYQFVSRNFIPNTDQAYENLGYMMIQGRLAGLIDWNRIVDRTRNLESLAHFSNPAGIIAAAADQYRIDKWGNQDNYLEVWIEKDALIGVIEPVCETLDVPYFSCRGYTSLSEIWNASRRLNQKNLIDKKEIVIIHLGDHDPSGLDMTRDIKDRLELFMDKSPTIMRVALNMDQIEEFNPPPNPTKVGDSRSPDYVGQYGENCWELDALDPLEIQKIVKRSILAYRVDTFWDEAVARENTDREKLAGIADDLLNE